MKRESPHIILDRAVAELGRDDLEYLSVQPATFGHRRVGVPVRRDLAQAWTRGRGCWRGSGDGVRRHGGEEHATKDVPELVRGGHEDEREVDLVRVEGKDGQGRRRRFQLRGGTEGRECEQWTQVEVREFTRERREAFACETMAHRQCFRTNV